LFLGVELDAESAALALGDVDGVAVAAADLVEDGWRARPVWAAVSARGT
jgi:hypothetical protein